MNEENAEFVRQAYEAIAAIGTERVESDMETLAPEVWARIHPEFELYERADLPDSKVHRGRDQAKAFWGRVAEVFSEMQWDVRELVEIEDAIVADTRLTATGRGSQVSVEVDEFNVFWFRDGLLIRLAGFGTKEEALASIE